MSIVRNAVASLDGTIEIDSTPGEGTAVTIILPVRAGSEPGEAASRPPNEPAP